MKEEQRTTGAVERRAKNKGAGLQTAISIQRTLYTRLPTHRSGKVPGIWKAWDYGGDLVRAGDFTGVDHNEELHQIVIDFTATRLDDVHVFTSDRFLIASD